MIEKTDQQRIDDWQKRVLGRVLGKDESEERRVQVVKQKMADYQAVFLNSEVGQRVLLDLLTVLGEFEIVDDFNAKAYAFLGKRMVAQYIKALIGETDKDLTSLYNLANLIKTRLPQKRER